MDSARVGLKGNFELVAPSSQGGLVHYWRNNDLENVPWAGPVRFAAEVGQVDAVALMPSNYGTTGNLEVIVRSGDELSHLWRDEAGWHEPALFFRGAAVIPGFIQSRYGVRGNFEVVTPLRKGVMAHLWRNNDNEALPWVSPAVFGKELSVRFDAVALIQSNFGPPGPSNLEMVAKAGIRVAHFWRTRAAVRLDGAR